MLSSRRRTSARLTGNVRFGTGGSRGFLGRFTLSTLSCTRLIRRTSRRLTRNARFSSGGGRRFLGRFSLSAFSCTRLIRRAGLLRDGRFRARQVCASRFWRFWFRLLRLFSPLLLSWPWCRLFLWLLRESGSSQCQRHTY